ncbi:RNA methyltransferase tRNA(m5U54)methyltransferase [Sorochytrium milnesiophthora]
MASGTATFQDSQYATITEGKATILFPTNNEVFYNPVQEFNRDMSVAALRTWHGIWAEEKRARLVRKAATDPTIDTQQDIKFSVLEALAATGLRSIRYAKEVPGIERILANDLDPEAVENIRRNAAFNSIDEPLIQPNCGDAMQVLYAHLAPLQNFDVIDLDPYGSASVFLDGAVQAVSDGGLLCITCTDMQVLAGANFTETCFSKYGGMPLKGEFCHEMALRLVLHALQTSAARYKRQIVPVLSCSIDFYVRLFVRVHRAPVKVKLTASQTSLVHKCQGCAGFELTPFGRVAENPDKPGNVKYGWTSAHVGSECKSCGSRLHIGGPIWNGPLHDRDFVARMLAHVAATRDDKLYKTQPRMTGMLTVISEELDAPLYWSLKDLTRSMHCQSISLADIGSALCNAGYKVSISHASPISVKTDAPSGVVWDVMRAHAMRNAVKVPEDTQAVAYRLLHAARVLPADVDFTFNKQANPPSRKIKLLRFQENPTKNWGPKARAGKKRKAGEEGQQPVEESAAKRPASAGDGNQEQAPSS